MRQLTFLFILLFTTGAHAEFFPGYTPGFGPPPGMYPYAMPGQSPYAMPGMSPYGMNPMAMAAQNPMMAMMMQMQMNQQKGPKYQRRLKAGDSRDMSAFGSALAESQQQAAQAVAEGQRFSERLVQSGAQRTAPSLDGLANIQPPSQPLSPAGIDDMLSSIQKNQEAAQKTFYDAVSAMHAEEGKVKQGIRPARMLASTMDERENPGPPDENSLSNFQSQHRGSSDHKHREIRQRSFRGLDLDD